MTDTETMQSLAFHVQAHSLPARKPRAPLAFVIIDSSSVESELTSLREAHLPLPF